MFPPFPSKLHHEVPSWVENGALFHIRIGVDRDRRQQPVTDPELAEPVLQSVVFYEQRHRWHITLFVLLPDHLHALLTFPRNEAMSRVIGDWKRFHARKNRVLWQEGYFDHRLRDDERGQQLSMKMNYIRRNPFAAGLCANNDDWPWILIGGSHSYLLDE